MSMVALVAAAVAATLAGVWTNEEQVSFANEAGKPTPLWTGLSVARSGTGWQATPVDALGTSVGPVRALSAAEVQGASVRLVANGDPLDMRQARPFRCWAAVPRKALKEDGSQDWWGDRAILLHDQGGKAELVTDEAQPQRFTIKMRNVVWPSGPNQPSLVLYVFTPEGGDRAISYSWADPQAKRIGINLRTVQASCALAEAPAP